MLYSSVSTRLNNRFCCITKTFNGTNEKWNTNSTKRKRYVMADRSTPTEHFNAVSHVCISRAVCAFCSIPFRFGTEWRAIQQTNEQDFSLYMNTLFLSFHMSLCVCVHAQLIYQQKQCSYGEKTILGMSYGWACMCVPKWMQAIQLAVTYWKLYETYCVATGRGTQMWVK